MTNRKQRIICMSIMLIIASNIGIIAQDESNKIGNDNVDILDKACDFAATYEKDYYGSIVVLYNLYDIDMGMIYSSNDSSWHKFDEVFYHLDITNDSFFKNIKSEILQAKKEKPYNYIISLNLAIPPKITKTDLGTNIIMTVMEPPDRYLCEWQFEFDKNDSLINFNCDTVINNIIEIPELVNGILSDSIITAELKLKFFDNILIIASHNVFRFNNESGNDFFIYIKKPKKGLYQYTIRFCYA